MKDVFVCSTGEIPDGGMKLIEAGDLEIGVFFRAGQYYAYQNLCPHQGGPACEGVRMPRVVDEIDERGLCVGQSYDESDMRIICPWHSYEFHLVDGSHVGDKNIRLRKFEVVQRDGEIYVAL